MRFRIVAGFAAASVAALLATGASADTFVLTNTTHPEFYSPGGSGSAYWDGNGFVTPISGGYTLFGADTQPQLPNTTTFVATALAAEVVTFNWTYRSFDSLLTSYDPAGYILDDVKTQLSVTAPSNFHSDPQTGTITFNLQAGQTYGFYVFSTDSHEGRGQISFVGGPVAAVPEPSTWMTMVVGVGLVGAALRRRRKLVAA